MKRLAVFMLAVFVFLAGGADGQQSRIDRLEASLLAPCCWQEPLSTHRSELSLQMKAEIASFVAQGKSDREILDYYVARYGRRVLVEPDGAQWWVMNIVPVVMTVLGALVVISVIRRLRRRPPVRPAEAR